MSPLNGDQRSLGPFGLFTRRANLSRRSSRVIRRWQQPDPVSREIRVKVHFYRASKRTWPNEHIRAAERAKAPRGNKRVIVALLPLTGPYRATLAPGRERVSVVLVSL
jgi:hypothetical protein